MLAAQAIQCGDAAVIVAGGTENMSLAPYLLPKARTGYRMGNGELVDSDDSRRPLGRLQQRTHGHLRRPLRGEIPVSRAKQQDDFAVASYQRAIEAQQKGLFAEEIAPVEIAGRKGRPSSTATRGRAASTRRSCAAWPRPSASRAP